MLIEAVHYLTECLRNVICERFKGLGLKLTNLPLGVDAEKKRYVRIWLSDDIETNKEKLLVIVPHTFDSLGVWSVREMEGPGINVCSSYSLG